MSLNIVVLDGNENFLQFLDPDLCEITETLEKGGLRTIDLTYTFQEFLEDKELFKIGNKIWISGSPSLADCLYIINTPVKEDLYEKNTFNVDCEEVLVELNYAPLFQHTQIIPQIYDIDTTYGKFEVNINYNALNDMFGKYFNIGIVQKAINPSHNKISVTGSMTLMTLLRHIEEETGNVFVTRYEKDIHTNAIYRYLDFLNPVATNKNWTLHLNYDFSPYVESECYDEFGNLSREDYPSEVYPFDDEDHQLPSTYDPDDDEYDFEDDKVYNHMNYVINPEDVDFRIIDDQDRIYNVEGEVYQQKSNEPPLQWSSEDIGFTSETEHCVIEFCKERDTLGVVVNEKTFVATHGPDEAGENDREFVSMANDPTMTKGVIPDDAYFAIWDTVKNKPLFKTCLNTQIGHVHEEILDFGFNVDNIEFERDESDTYNAISPSIQIQDGSDSLSRDQIGVILNNWKNLEVTKGDLIPYTVEKANKNSSSCPSDPAGSYCSRPLKPSDDPSNSKWEYWVGTAYWTAPFTKNAGEFHIETESGIGVEYNMVSGKQDSAFERAYYTPKMGSVDTSEEDCYAIYNTVAKQLKDSLNRDFNITVDVANLKDKKFNDYELHDKIYVKLPGQSEIVTARVSKLTKDGHDIAKNTIELSNYSTEIVKSVLNETYIEGDNQEFEYPAESNLTVRLLNQDYDPEDEYSEEFLINKLLTFTVRSSGSPTGIVYTKVTNPWGYATIHLAFEPGDYTIDVFFAGDDEYLETLSSINVTVTGEIEKQNDTNKKKSKVKKKKKAKYKTIKRYWDKFGRSPDKKKIKAIGRNSAGKDKFPYRVHTEAVFENRCTGCGKRGTLVWGIWWAGKQTDYGYFEGTKSKEGGSADGHIFCTHCDADFSAEGNGHPNPYKSLKVIEKSKKSSTSRAALLRKGKLVYDTQKIRVGSKKWMRLKNHDRKIKGNPSKAIRQQALRIVGDSKGITAAKRIAKWMDDHIDYPGGGYNNFVHSASNCLRNKRGNCCDQTRLFFELCDAAGGCEYLDLWYVHVPGHVYAKVITKSTKRSRYVDCASDSHAAWGYVCQGYRHGSGTSKYPNKPF